MLNYTTNTKIMSKLTTTTAVVAILTAISISSFSQDNINMALGNPSAATPDTTKAENYLMVKPQYCLSYSNSRHIPNWACWHVGITDLDTCRRKDKCHADAALPAGWYQVTPLNYKNSGFDNVQMCPFGDRTTNADNISATFLMTNVVPLAPNSRTTWEQLESYCRKLVKQGNELYIISGPCGQGGSGTKGFSLELQHNIAVPMQVWKIIVVLPEGDDDVNRINKSTRVIAVLMPNNQDCSRKNWGDYRVTVDELQSLTGYNFLSNIPKDIQKILEAKADYEKVN
jgi:endonuclease G